MLYQAQVQYLFVYIPQSVYIQLAWNHQTSMAPVIRIATILMDTKYYRERRQLFTIDDDIEYFTVPEDP